MAANILYTLSGSGISITHGTESTTELTLDDTYSPPSGTYHVAAGDLTRQPTSAGIQLAGVLRWDEVGRGGPIHKTAAFTLFLPDAPEPADSPVENDATGAVVFADPDPRATTAPEYRAESLTGTVSVPAA